MNNKSLTLAYTAAITTLLIWSGTVVANKIAVAYLDGFSVGILRSIIAGTGATFFLSLFRFKLPANTKERTLLVLSGIASFAAWPILMSIGVQFTTAGHTALIVTLIPILTVSIKLVTERTLPSLRWLTGALLALTATIILILETKFVYIDGKNTEFYFGDSIVLFGALLYAIGFVSGSHVSSYIGATATTFWGLAFSLVIAIPASFFSSINILSAHLSMGFWFSMVWMAVLSSLAGYVLWFFALSKGGVNKIASLQLAMPVISLAFAYVFLDEDLSPTLAIACVIILAGVFIAQKHAQAQ